MPIKIKDANAPATVTTEAQPYSVQTSADSAKAARFAPSEMEPPFVLFHHPRRWQLDGDGLPIPSFAKMAIEPGIGGVDSRGNWGAARAQREQAGEIMIPETAATASDTPDGAPGYVRRTVTGSGAYFHTAWERIVVLDGEGKVEQVDPAGYRKWLTALATRGIIPDISDRTIARLTETLERGLAGEVDRATEGSKRAATQIKRQIAGLEKWATARAQAVTDAG